VERQSATALELARRLARHPRVRRVHYPGLEDHPHHERAVRLMRGGFGGVLSLETAGGRPGAIRCMEGFRWIRCASSLGGAHTLVSHPATSSHAGLSPAERRAQGIGEGCLRLALGLESVEDLWEDLERGLARV
jgi:cystathionine beta-lyase/cystathionine gamma-synthase